MCSRMECVSEPRTGQAQLKWTLKDYGSWCAPHLASTTSPVFEDAVHHTKWVVEVKRHYDLHPYSTTFHVNPLKENPRHRVECELSFLAADGGVKNGPHRLDAGAGRQASPASSTTPRAGHHFYQPAAQRFVHQINPSMDRERGGAHATDLEALLGDDGHLTLVCRVRVTDIVHDARRRHAAEAAAAVAAANDWGRLLTAQGYRFSDVALHVGGETLAAHKAVLALRSPVFDAMFQPETKESQNNRVDLDDVDADLFRSVLAFMYTGRLDDAESDFDRLLVVADRFQIDALKDICQHQLADRLTVANVVDTLILADLHSAVELKTRCLQFLHWNRPAVFETFQWRTFVESYPKLIAELFMFQNRQDGLEPSS